MKSSFYIRFADTDGYFSVSQGISISLLSDLLSKLESAIKPNDDSSSYVTEIKTDSYGLKVESDSIERKNNLRVVHKSISNNEFDESDKNIYDYAKVLKKILSPVPNAFLEVYSDDVFLGKISEIKIDRGKKTYTTEDSFTGVISLIGSKKLEDDSHIYIDGYENRILVTKEEEAELEPLFKKDIISIRILKKFNSDNNKIIESKLLSYKLLSEKIFPESFTDLSNNDLSFLDDINTIEDFINL